MSKNALKVLYHLKRHGFQAYLVGGGVRDLLLGVSPKDFDIATNAHPEQIKNIFYNALLIGKRFRIAHIRFSGEIIEVTTFRGETKKAGHRRLSAAGMLLRDNVYGTLEEDVWRRDFSINALYYNIRDFSIVDYCHGMEDIRNKKIRIIGEANQRYQEDPVRLLRAIRLAAKFPEFTFETKTEVALLNHVSLLASVSNSRLFEETLKLFHGGYAVRSYRLLKQYRLFPELFPVFSKDVENTSNTHWIETALAHTDRRFMHQQTLSPAFLFSVLLWPVLVKEIEFMQDETIPESMRYTTAIRKVIGIQQTTTSFTRFCSQMMKDIWMMQSALIKRKPSQVKRLLEHPRFRAAYDFLLLRVECGELPKSLGSWWTKKVAKESG